jgi:glutamate-1-semialdehyde 2,1-aminomutase
MRDGVNITIDDALADAVARYTAANPASAARHAAAKAGLPGGNTRAVLWYDPFPLAMAGGAGATVTDLDGHTYIDLVSEYTAGVYGHSDPVIRAAMIEALEAGWVLGAPNRWEGPLAAAIVARFPGVERVRFCNSGTEANLMALSVARAVTGRDAILVMNEGYHGGILTFAHGGSVLNAPYDFRFADYNDVSGVTAAIAGLGDRLAAVILEPMLGGGGCIAADPAFLAAIRAGCDATGALMVLDEVMTSRLAPGGLHGAMGVRPDLVTLGKYLGGGASFGAFGGRADIMDRFDPATPGAFGHGGTFNNNVLSMAGGLAGITQVFTPEACLAMNARGDRLREGLDAIFAREGVAACVTGVGSIMNVHFVPGPVTDPHAVEAQDRRFLRLWHIEMLLRGLHVTPRGMLALSLPFGEAEVDTTLSAAADFAATHRAVLPQRAAPDAPH